MREPPRSADVMIGICALVIGGGALFFARPVLAPIAFALFIAALVWPIQRRLQAHLPKIAAVAISIVVTTVVITAFGSTIAWGFTRVAYYIVDDAARLQALYGQVSDWLDTHGIVLAELWTEHFNVGWLVRVLRELTIRLNSTLTLLLVVLLYLVLGLLEVDDMARKLGRVVGPEVGRALVAGAAKSAARLRRYMLVRTLMSLMTGLLVWAFASYAGIALALEWGVIAFALNYIPFIGPFIATVFPTLFAMAQFESWQMAVAVFGFLNLIQFLVGSYLEPRIAGSALSISPSVVLFAVFLWTFLWGIAGAFIGVPIMIAVLTLCEQHPSSRWVADLLGAPDDAPG